MARLLGREPDPELVARVYARSEGNPLFLEALLRRDEMLEPGLPESFNVMVKELQSLALDVELLEDRPQ